MKESKIEMSNYAVINLNTATLIHNGEVATSVYPFNDLDGAMTFMSLVLGSIIPEVRCSIANKYLLVDKDCNKYTFEVIGTRLVLFSGMEPIARVELD